MKKKKKATKPNRNVGNENHVPIPPTKPHSDRVRVSKKEQRRQAQQEANQQETRDETTD